MVALLISLVLIYMFLNVVAQRDDSIGLASSIAHIVGSNDKDIIEFPSSHVGLIIRQQVHKAVWLKVGDWSKHKSQAGSGICF